MSSIKKSVANKLIVFCFIVFTYILNVPNSAFAGDKYLPKNVLIINSYHEGFQWTKEETDGILDEFKESGDNYSFFIEYMDWKNYPNNENKQNFYNYLKFKYQNKKIDIILTTDDAALDFTLKNKKELLSDAPVVFCGINNIGAMQLINTSDNFTGVLEDIDPEQTVKMALELNPTLKNVYILYDDTESGITTGQICKDKIQSMFRGLNTIALNNLKYDELIKYVRNLKKDSIILFTSYYNDADNKAMEFKFLSREVSKNSSVPVFHLYDMGINNGATGGSMMSGTLQGKKAADIALRILNGENADSIQFQYQKTDRKVLDYEQVRRFKLPLNKVSSDTEIINKPFSLNETDKQILFGSVTLISGLIIFVCILLFDIYRINKMKKRLSNNHNELSHIYEELAESDEELRHKYREISTIQKKLLSSEERYRVATDGSDAIIWDFDIPNMKYHFSDRWYELLGYEKGEVNEVNGGWKKLIHPDDVNKADKAREAHLNGNESIYNTEYRMKKKNGEYIWFNVRGSVLKDNKGKNIRFAGSLIDITKNKEYETRLQDSYQELEATNEELTAAQDELKDQYDELLKSNEMIRKTEKQLAYLAYYDSLTELPNKESLYKDENCIIQNQKDRAAILFIDIDHFKYINDTMGHAFGDKLIKKVSERLVSLQDENSSIYRISGDEFIIAMKNIDGSEDAVEFTNRIIESFRQKFIVLNSVINVGLSVGIAVYPEHGTNIDELLKHADIAMYMAKNNGRNSYYLYEERMNEEFTERVNIETHLHSALEKNEFEIYYQPQLDLKTYKITGFEALLRWNCKELGPIPPDKFIQIAEKNHQIIPLGTWVLKNSCAFLKRLHLSGYSDLYVSVNISMLQLVQSNFSDLVIKTLEDYQLDAKYLELEITETVVMDSYKTVLIQLEKLNNYGVRIALDDFGKGYSSLSYLKQLPITTLKIDKSFIDSIYTKGDNGLLTEYIVDLGKKMGMSVVAEGVETKEQMDYLAKHECNKIQGYYCSRPVPENQIISLLEKV